ncbi:MAG: S8 family serine peptidase, partial [Pseudomonadota bacterium]
MKAMGMVGLTATLALVGNCSSPGTGREKYKDTLKDAPVPVVSPDMVSLDPELGVSAVRTRLGVIFSSEATAAEVNELLTELDAKVIGVMEDLSLITIEIPDAPDFSLLHNALARLESHPLVEVAIEDLVSAPDRMPNPTTAMAGGKEWKYDGSQQRGNWGLMAIRVPQTWNLLDHALNLGSFPQVAIIDSGFDDRDGDGFDDHPDFDRFLNTLHREGDRLVAGSPSDDHGTHVAGIVGAKFNDSSGVEGVCPLFRHGGLLVGIRLPPPVIELLDLLRLVFRTYPDVRLINISAGYGWIGDLNNLNNLPAIAVTRMVNIARVYRYLMKTHPSRMIVSSAGNRGVLPGGIDASAAVANGGYGAEPHTMFNSHYNTAARYPMTLHIMGEDLLPSQNIFVVESVDYGLTKRSSSNVGGLVSAPGGEIMSTTTNGNHDLMSGTSMAAPHVTGVIAFLLALDHNLIASEIRGMLVGEGTTQTVAGRAGEVMPNQVNGVGAVSVAGPARMIDAFAMAMHIDTVRGDKKLQRKLCDVDDGTRDGNLREKPFTDDQGDTKILTSTGRRGDGSVNMRDFRFYRDTWLKTASVPSEEVYLDGSSTHFKKDFNLDGVVVRTVDASTTYRDRAFPAHPLATDDPPVASDAAVAKALPESSYPRCDFNGDGLVNSDRAVFKGARMLDVEVLADDGVWDASSEGGENVAGPAGPDEIRPGAAGQWSSTSLLGDRDSDGTIDYLKSCDVHLKLPEGHRVEYLAGASPAPVGTIDPGEVLFAKRIELPAAGKHVITIPIFEVRREPKIFARLADGSGVIKEFFLPFRPDLGEDFALEIDWSTLKFSTAQVGVSQPSTTSMFPPARQREIWFNYDNTYGSPLYSSGVFAESDAATNVARLKTDLESHRDSLEHESELHEWLASSLGVDTEAAWPVEGDGSLCTPTECD